MNNYKFKLICDLLKMCIILVIMAYMPTLLPLFNGNDSLFREFLNFDGKTVDVVLYI